VKPLNNHSSAQQQPTQQNHQRSHQRLGQRLIQEPLVKQSLLFWLLGLAITQVSRVGLALWQSDRFESSGDWLSLLVNGLRIDLSLLATLSLFPIVVYLISRLLPRTQQPLYQMASLWLRTALITLLFMEIITPTFIMEFGVRPNRLFIEYLGHYKEVGSMIGKGFLATLLITIAALSVALYLFNKLWPKPKGAHNTANPSIKTRMRAIGITLILLMIDIIVDRSGFQHRPINPAMVAFSNDRLLNSLALNSTYSVAYAAYRMTNESAIAESYGKMEWSHIIEQVNKPWQAQHVAHPKIPSLHYPTPVGSEKDYQHLVIVVEESLGAHFVASLGGKPVSPNIEQWRHNSWFFDRLYATGIRSARGLEAITTGFPPSPARAALKLPKAQGDFFTIANYLKQEGFYSQFIYGGESHFDNMKGFFLANGFDRVIDQNDYDHPKFMGSWGVSDEDLFERAFDEMMALQHQKTFTLIFTSSNHPPYEFPDDAIELYESPKATELNAGKYADYALGQFLDRFVHSPLFSTSLMLVVADHEDKVYGTEPVPYRKFRIPAFIIGKTIAPRIDTRLASQIDLAPTLLSLMGLNRPHPMIGRDLNHPLEDTGRAIMQYGHNQAYMTDHHIVYLQPEKAPLVECLDNSPCQLDKATEQQLFNVALAHALFTHRIYQQQGYRLPNDTALADEQ
jgi:phosphoglycerol transferase MdoB-like AlkP superfamily enzyme